MKVYDSYPPFTSRRTQYADCYVIQTVDGITLLLTTLDRDILVGQPAPTTFTTYQKYGSPPFIFGPQSLPGADGLGGSRFISLGALIQRNAAKGQKGRLMWTIGTKPSQFTFDILNSPSQAVDLGLSLPAAVRVGLFDGALVRLWRVFIASGFTINADGSVSGAGGTPLRPMSLFFGEITAAQATRLGVQFTVSDIRVRLNQVLPRFVFQPSCRWTLYDAGCTVDPASYGAICTITSVTDAGTFFADVAPNPSVGPVGLNTGYYSLGYLQMQSGPNLNLKRQIAVFLNQDQSYPTVVLNDQPFVYYRFNDPPGSVVARDFSGNGFHGFVHPPVAFGQAPLKAAVGDTSTSLLINQVPAGGGYIECPAPGPFNIPNYGGGVTFEFLVKLPTPTLDGLFDTGPGQNNGLRCCPSSGSNGLVCWNILNGAPNSIYQLDDPTIECGTLNSVANQVWHIVIVYYNNRSINLYINGALFGVTQSGGSSNLAYAWGKSTRYFGPDGIPENVNIGIVKQVANNQPFHWFGAGNLVSDFAIYNYPFSADIPYYHFIAALAPWVPGLPPAPGAGQFQLAAPLIYPPNVGDHFVAYPGCARTTRVCAGKFRNIINYGGFPVAPEQELAV